MLAAASSLWTCRAFLLLILPFWPLLLMLLLVPLWHLPLRLILVLWTLCHTLNLTMLDAQEPLHFLRNLPHRLVDLQILADLRPAIPRYSDRAYTNAATLLGRSGPFRVRVLHLTSLRKLRELDVDCAKCNNIQFWLWEHEHLWIWKRYFHLRLQLAIPNDGTSRHFNRHLPYDCCWYDVLEEADLHWSAQYLIIRFAYCFPRIFPQ